MARAILEEELDDGTDRPVHQQPEHGRARTMREIVVKKIGDQASTTAAGVLAAIAAGKLVSAAGGETPSLR